MCLRPLNSFRYLKAVSVILHASESEATALASVFDEVPEFSLFPTAIPKRDAQPYLCSWKRVSPFGSGVLPES